MSVRRSLVLSIAQNHSILVIRLLSLVIVSRLVQPHELGVFLIAQGLVTLGLMFADFGIQQYVVSASDTSRIHEARALGAGMLTTCVAIVAELALAFVTPSSVLDEKVRLAIALLIGASVLTPFTSVAKSVLQRDMRYAELYWIATLAALAGVGATIVLALGGFGFLSLVGGAMTETLVTSAIALSRHFPPWPTIAGASAVLGFGGVITAMHGVKQAGDAAVPLQIEVGLGLGVVGILGRAQSILLLFDRLVVDALSHVLLPLLAARRRTGADITGIRPRMIAGLTATAWPFFGLLALLAPQVIDILLGPQWGEAAPPLRILCLAGLLLPFHALIMPYLVALGIAHRFLPWQAAIQVVKLVLVLAAALRSLELVCVVLVLERAAATILGQRLLFSALGPLPRKLLTDVIASACVSVVAIATGAVSISLLGPCAGAVVGIVVCTAAALPAWLAAVFLLRHPLLQEFTQVRTAACDTLLRWRNSRRAGLN